ncbi:GLPGLI family protein [Mucilaginibacter sp. 14171R-50]|uniref:GLPGLI family protein n=1 Tax=Mucilaginibacter sp. 14171R-50 TaxID=2703789 RepID=UPI00138D1742|nr:GLPGLI family protein [Mucilaginibacter sp. 14171R-50]QHS55533.1 GLPGLI family protein [Mucilaginibacter sp. 14171R-50]
MKKLFTLILCMCAAALAAHAQKPDTTQAVVHYKFSHLRDTLKPNEPYTENMVLFLGRNASVYKSYDRKMQDAMMRKQIADQIKANAGAGGNINIKRGGPGITNNEYYMYPAQKKLVRKERLVNNYLIEEPLPVINWKISADTASFSGLKCQKATGHFAGRDYTAWFCPDLPFHSGPWKLNGLPGLIVEAYDTNKQVVFKFDGMDDASKLEKPAPGAGDGSTIQSGGMVVKMIGMEDANEDPGIISLPSTGIKTTEKEFTKLKEAMKKDPAAFMQSAMAASGATMRIAPGVNTNMKFQVANGPVINNPLELPEKK